MATLHSTRSREQEATWYADSACANGGCGGARSDPYASGLLERPRFFPRQIVTHNDLNLEADYFRARLRRHNRLLHGWGVVCGARVCRALCADGQGFQRWRVRVSAGYILSPQGDEILLQQDQIVDLRSAGAVFGGGASERDEYGEWSDPWCSEVALPQQAGTRYLAVRYQELATRPVRPQPAECTCDDGACEQSRWCDGYEIGVLDCCPYPRGEGRGGVSREDWDTLRPASTTMPRSPYVRDIGEEFFALECPACPSSPWVGLAEIEIDHDGTILRIDNCSCRRHVASFASFWGQCQSRVLRCRVESIDPGASVRPDTEATLVVTGENFTQDIDVDLGQGVAIKSVTVSDSTSLTVVGYILPGAAPGPRDLMLTSEDCATATCTDALVVVAEEPPEERPRRRRPRGH